MTSTYPRPIAQSSEGSRKRRKISSKAAAPIIAGEADQSPSTAPHGSATINSLPGQRHVAKREQSPPTAEDNTKWVTLAKVNINLVCAIKILKRVAED